MAAAACTLLTTSTIMAAAAAAPSSTVQTKAPQTSHVSQNVKAGMLSEVLSLLRMMLICSSAMSPSLRLTTNLGGAATSHQSLQQPIPPPPSSPLVGSILAHYLSPTVQWCRRSLRTAALTRRQPTTDAKIRFGGGKRRRKRERERGKRPPLPPSSFLSSSARASLSPRSRTWDHPAANAAPVSAPAASW